MKRAKHLQTLDNAGSKRLSGVWLESWLLFGIQVLWKNVYLRKTVRQRAAALFGPWGYKLWRSFFLEKTLQKAEKFNFSLLSEAVSCPHGGGQCIILLRRAWMKEKTLSWGFALIWISWKEQESGSLSSASFQPSFISYSPHPSHPSLSRAPQATRCSPCAGPGFLLLLRTCCWQIVLSVAAHYCTFSCLSQHIKCIKDEWNSATNKASTTADRVDGWSPARERVWSLVYNVPACVYLEDSAHTKHKERNKQHVTQSGTRQTCLMKLLSTESFDLTLI